MRSAFAVVAGGPGTGKTTTVARIVVLLDEQAAAAGRPLPRVALAAPTGKAAARLEEAVHAEARRARRPGRDVAARLLGLSAVTLHRLLGWRPGTRSRFRHDRTNRLPFDVVIVDETSMVSTSMMANLVDAVGSDARLILVGDPDQLASVEAGAVLGDIVGPAAGRHDPDASSPIGDGIVVLRRVHRFGGAIAELAAADPPRRRRRHRSTCCAPGTPTSSGSRPLGDATGAGLGPVRERIVAAGRRIIDAARDGDAAAALDALGEMRVLCAHRRGPYGVTGWTAHIERWLAESIDGYAADGLWYIGRPLLVTANDYALRLYNGDTGVIVRSPDPRRRRRLPARRHDRRDQPPPHLGRRHRPRDDDPQEPGLPVRRRRRRAPRADVADPDAGAAVHRVHQSPTATDRGRHGGEHRRGGHPPDHPSDRAPGAALA